MSVRRPPKPRSTRKREARANHTERPMERAVPRLLLACFRQSPDGKEIREHLAELIASFDRTLRAIT